MFFHDDFGVPPHGGQPRSEFLSIRHRRTQCGDDHLRRQVDDDFLPHGPPESVRQIVNFVHHDVAQVVQGGGTCVQHVAKDHGSLSINGGITGQQADGVASVPLHQLRVLLIRQSLDGRRVEALCARLNSTVDGKLPDNGFARSCRCGDQYAAAGFESAAPGQLKFIKCELV